MCYTTLITLRLYSLFTRPPARGARRYHAPTPPLLQIIPLINIISINDNTYLIVGILQISGSDSSTFSTRYPLFLQYIFRDPVSILGHEKHKLNFIECNPQIMFDYRSLFFFLLTLQKTTFHIDRFLEVLIKLK